MHLSSKGALRALSLLFLGALTSCMDPDGSGALSGTSLYVYNAADGAANRVQVWDNLETRILEKVPVPTRQLSGAHFDKVKDLAWGGMVVDAAGGRLYLVSRTGDVVRVERVRQQNGAVTSTQDIFSFRLGNSTDRLSGGHFEQAAFDGPSNTLFVMETNDSEARVWRISAPNQYQEGAIVQASFVGKGGHSDKLGYGLAAGRGELFASFLDGGTVTDLSQNRFTGPRLRRAAGDSFALFGNVLVGDNTGLKAHGVLAYDSSNNQVFVARHLKDSGATGQPIQVFRLGQFEPGYNAAPIAALGGTNLDQVRTLATAPAKSWLVGSSGSDTLGGNLVHVWATPLSVSDPVNLNAGTGVQIRAVALDGNN